MQRAWVRCSLKATSRGMAKGERRGHCQRPVVPSPVPAHSVLLASFGFCKWTAREAALGRALVQPSAEQGTLAEAGLEQSARGALLVLGSQHNGVPETACRQCPGEEKEISQLFTSFFPFWSSTAGVCGKRGGYW